MAFKADEKLEKLDYDFTPYVDLKGTIPEPSTKQVETFQQVMAKIYQDAGGVIQPDEGGKIKVTAENIDSVLAVNKEIDSAMAHAVADVTGFADQTLQKLPPRLRTAFVGWIAGVFLAGPEA